MTTQSGFSNPTPHLSSEDIAKGIVRIDEVIAQLKAIQSNMSEKSVDSLAVGDTHLLTQGVDSLIQFVAQAEHHLATEIQGRGAARIRA